jgi:tetratricopeptide (TPR) repeat protein
LASGSSSDFDVKLWDTITGQEMLALRGHRDPILSVAFNPNGDRLVSAGGDMLKIWNATVVSSDRVDQRVAYDWVHANFSHKSGVENEDALWEPETLHEPARTLALQMARHRADQIGRIPAYYNRLGNELWLKGWSEFARRQFALAENGFRKNVALNPARASAHGDFALFLTTCPEPQFRDAANALTHAQKAIGLDPANADFAALLGMAQYRSREWQAAVDSLEKAIERRPPRYLGAAELFLCMAHHQLGHTTEARQAYQQALTEIKEDGSREELGHLRAEAAIVLHIPESTPATETKHSSP